jgi:hypothetical protein
MRSLPDVRRGRWAHGRTACEVGVAWCRVGGGYAEALPLSVKHAGRNIYPVFDEPRLLALTLDEVRTCSKIYDVKILDAYGFVPEPGCPTPYGVLVDKLFALKQAHAPTDARYLTAKLVLNSLYGKTVEVRKDGDAWKAGRQFNPIYGAETTARVRCLMRRTIEASKCDDAVVSVLTDGLILDRDVDIPDSGELGGFSLKHRGEDCLMLRSGIYEWRGKEVATRGFRKRSADGTPVSLYSMADTDGLIHTTSHRPLHLRECLRTQRFDDLNRFCDVRKDLDLSNDLKRVWPSCSPKDLLGSLYKSQAIPVSVIDLLGAS